MQWKCVVDASKVISRPMDLKNVSYGSSVISL